MKKFRHILSLVIALFLAAATAGSFFYAHHCRSLQQTSILWEYPEENCCNHHGSCCTETPATRPVDDQTVFSPVPCCSTYPVYLVLDSDYDTSRPDRTMPPTSQGLILLITLPRQDGQTGHPYQTLFVSESPPRLSGRELVLFMHQPKIPFPSAA